MAWSRITGYVETMLSSTGLPETSLPEALRAALAERIASGRLEIPVLPEAALRLAQAAGREDVAVQDLIRILRQDPALAGNLLAVVNSATFVGSEPLTSLEHCVPRLGLRRVRNLAMAVALRTRIFDVPGWVLAVRALFRHSLAAARWCEVLADGTDWPASDAYLAGLLHDVAKPVLLDVIVTLAAQAGEELTPAVVESTLDLLHARLGAQMVRRWKLGDDLATLILHHHQPDQAGALAERALTLALADDLSHWTVGPRQVDRWAMERHPAWPRLGRAAEIEQIIAWSPGIRAEVDAILREGP